MSRIRSIHPKFFTDEAVVSCSQAARLLVIGLWSEADDQGVFEWKPVSLKMRIFPADVVDVEALLAELASQNFIRQFYATDGRAHGAIKNFRKYQRPRSPRALYELPYELRSYVGLARARSELSCADGPLLPQNDELHPQMEGKGEDEGDGRGEGRLPPEAAPEALMQAWNELTTLPIPRCRELTPKRRSQAQARSREQPTGQWREVIARIEGSAFCRGENDRGWLASFDWLLLPDTAIKVSEGKYDDRPGKRGSSGRDSASGPSVQDAEQSEKWLAERRAEIEGVKV